MARALVWYGLAGSFVIFAFIELPRVVPTPSSSKILFRIPYTYCLPSWLKPLELSSVKDRASVADSLKRKLDEVGVQCSLTRNLVDEHGREIVFYRLRNCFSSSKKEDIKAIEDWEMNQLRAKYTVIPVACLHRGR